jgi:tetratricopeptide (TPR) repeat protein
MKTRSVYILITIVITSCILSGCSKSRGIENPTPTVDAAAIENAIGRADADFRDREDLDKLRDAVATLAAVRDSDNRNFEVESRFAKYNYFLGIHTDNEKEAAAAFDKGREAGKIASKLEPGKPDGYFWYGANLGELSRKNPITVGLSSVDDIQEAMNKVIEMQPNFQGGSAFDALAQVELATRIKDGKAEKAVQYLEKGVAIEDDNSNLHVHLAEAYLAVNRDKDARRQLEYVLKMTPNPDFLPEHRDAVAAAKRLLETKF